MIKSAKHQFENKLSDKAISLINSILVEKDDFTVENTSFQSLLWWHHQGSRFWADSTRNAAKHQYASNLNWSRRIYRRTAFRDEREYLPPLRWRKWGIHRNPRPISSYRRFSGKCEGCRHRSPRCSNRPSAESIRHHPSERCQVRTDRWSYSCRGSRSDFPRIRIPCRPHPRTVPVVRRNHRDPWYHSAT